MNLAERQAEMRTRWAKEERKPDNAQSHQVLDNSPDAFIVPRAACAAFIPVHVVVPNTHTGMWIEFSPEPNKPGPPCPVGRICI